MSLRTPRSLRQPAGTFPRPSKKGGWGRAWSPESILQRDPLFRLEIGAIWRWMRTQPPSFWLVSLYLLLEYIRPQQIYEVIAGWPIPFYTIILCGVAFLLEGGRFRRWHLGDALMAGATLIVVLCTITAYSPALARANYSVFFGWLAVYVLITNIVTNRHRFYVFMLLYLLYCTKMTQHGVRSWALSGFGFREYGVTCAPGWFQNSGECGAQMAVLFPVALFFFLAVGAYWSKWKRWLYLAFLPAGSLLTILGSSSRGAVVALAATGLWFVAKRRRHLKVLVFAAVVAGLSWHFVPAGFKARFQTMGEDRTSLRREVYWRDGLKIMHDFPLLGVGYYSWLPYYRRYYNDIDPQVPHNIFIEAGAQEGYLGLIIFVACIVGTFGINSRTRRLANELPGVGIFYRNMAHGLDGALIGFLVAGSFVTILYYPFFWINLAMAVSLNVATLNDVRGRRQTSLPPRVVDHSGNVRPSSRSSAPTTVSISGRS